MKYLVVTCIGLLLAMSSATPFCWATIFQFDNGAADGGLFLTPANWTDNNADADIGPPNDSSDRGIINNGFTSTYGSGTTTMGSLIVGADWPVTGELGTDGTLMMTGGKIIVTGAGDNFQIARARGAIFGDANGDGLIAMTNAELEIGGSDPIVGTRDHGVLDVGLNAKVYPTTYPDTTVQENYWRLGNYGPSVDAGLEGNGLLNVHSNGTFNAHVIFIGDNDATGELRVSETGSVVLTGNLVPRPSLFHAGGSAKVQMNGATATLSAYNLESASEVGEVPTLYEFNADSVLGVSPIELKDAINITGNDLVVNLLGYPLGLFDTLLLFDGDHTGALDTPVGNRIFGQFASSSIVGTDINHVVIYDQVNGDIYVQLIPEPSSLVLLGLGMVMVIGARRRASK